MIPVARHSGLENDEIAARLDEVAELLEAQHANPFRVRAYRQAAEQVRGMARPLAEIVETDGPQALLEIPHLGRSLARTVAQLAATGRWALLQRLRGDVAPERVLTTVPGIGREMAARISGQLGITSLGELQEAAYDGRLAGVPGMGRKRLDAVRDSLAGRFRRRSPLRQQPRRTMVPEPRPPVAELLDVDSEYRAKAQRDRLPRIAPRRFNPSGEAWLPILHTTRGERHYTALYSNTARAHEFDKTHDWVVVYRDDRGGDGQWTIITSAFGDLKGRRIVRGREKECADYYAASPETRGLPPTDAAAPG